MDEKKAGLRTKTHPVDKEPHQIVKRRVAPRLHDAHDANIYWRKLLGPAYWSDYLEVPPSDHIFNPDLGTVGLQIPSCSLRELALVCRSSQSSVENFQILKQSLKLVHPIGILGPHCKCSRRCLSMLAYFVHGT